VSRGTVGRPPRSFLREQVSAACILRVLSQPEGCDRKTPFHNLLRDSRTTALEGRLEGSVEVLVPAAVILNILLAGSSSAQLAPNAAEQASGSRTNEAWEDLLSALRSLPDPNDGFPQREPAVPLPTQTQTPFDAAPGNPETRQSASPEPSERPTSQPSERPSISSDAKPRPARPKLNTAARPVERPDNRARLRQSAAKREFKGVPGGAQINAAVRREERLKGRAQQRQAREQREQRSAQASRSEWAPSPSRRNVEPSAGLQLPEGLIPSHATRRE
jgi:hypothetical protein